MATDVYIKRTAIDLLRSRTHSTKSAYVAIGVLYSFGHPYLAAKFTHDYECHQALLSGNAIHLPLGNWPAALADTQRLIDQVVDDMEASLPHQPAASSSCRAPAEVPMPGQADETDEDDENELISSPKNDFEEPPGPVDANLVKTIIGERGIRRSIRPIYADQLANIAQECKLGWAPEDTDALALLDDNRHLRAKGEVPMPGQADETDEDDVNEIISSLKHDFEELPGPAGGNLIKTIIEKRGIRRSTRPIYADLLENIAQERKPGWTPDDTDALLFMAANRHLRAKGEQDFYAVAGMAEQVADAEGKDVTETTSRHFRLWSEAMEAKTGSLSIETAAARFIEARDRLLMMLNQTAEMQSAAFDYADAGHWLHMELFCEHELAAKGDVAERSLDAGRAAQKSKGALKSALIASCYERFATTETNETNRTTNAGCVAGEIIEEVNQAFTAKGLDPIAEGTLKNKLPAIIRDYRASRQNW